MDATETARRERFDKRVRSLKVGETAKLRSYDSPLTIWRQADAYALYAPDPDSDAHRYDELVGDFDTAEAALTAGWEVLGDV